MDSCLLILTPNNRLKELFIQQDISLDTSVKTLSNWLNEKWEEACKKSLFEPNNDFKIKNRHTFEYTILSDIEEELLWKKAFDLAIIQNPELEKTSTIKSFLEIIKKTNKQYYQWEITPKSDTENYFLNQEYEYFISIKNEFDKLLDTKSFICGYQLFDYVILALNKNIIFIEENIELLEFIYPEPRFVENTKKLQKFTKSIKNTELKNVENTKVSKIDCSSFIDEIEVVFRHIKNEIKLDNQNNQNKTIGVVISNLEERREYVEGLCNSVFGNTKVNISNKQSMVIRSDISLAIRLMEVFCYNSKINTADLINIILSSSWNLASDAIKKIAVNQISRKIEILDKNKVIEILLENELIDETKAKEIEVVTKKISFNNNWSENTLSFLDIVCWESSYKIDIFIEQINKIKLIDARFQITSREKLQVLKKILQKISHSTSTSKNSNIHILGLFESISISFDRLFVVDSTEGNFLHKAKYSNLIPRNIQDKYQMQSSEIWVQTFNDRVKNKFITQNKEVFFTYTQTLDLVKKPDFFLQDLPNIILDIKSILMLEEEYTGQEDTEYPRLNELDEQVSGGVDMLNKINTCPFSAQMKYRMRIKNIDFFENTSNSLYRGIKLHKLLELFWKKTKTKQKLLTLNKEEIICIVKSLDTEVKKNKLQEIEANNLQKIVANFISWEANNRSDDFEIIATEKEIELKIKDYVLKLVIDRIEKIATENKNIISIIDYKSSKKHIKPIQTSEDKNNDINGRSIQLIAYALCDIEYDDENTNADFVAFGYTNQDDDKSKISGVSLDGEFNICKAEECKTKSKKNEKVDKKDTLKYWHDIIVSSLDNYKQGLCDIEPDAISCNYCPYTPFCRQFTT